MTDKDIQIEFERVYTSARGQRPKHPRKGRHS